MGRRLDRLLDYTTDVVGIIALTFIAVHTTEVPIEVVTAITSIAIGQSYAKSKWDGAYGSSNSSNSSE